MAKKSINKIFLFPLSLIVIFFSSLIIIFSPVGKKNIIKLSEAPVEWKTYTNDQYGFEIQIPPDWEIEEAESGVFYLGKKGEEYYYEGSIERGAVLISFRATSKNSFEELFERYKMGNPNISVEKTKLGGIESGYIKFFGDQIFTINNNYEIFTNIIGFNDHNDVNTYTNIPRIYRQIISTFKFIK